MDELDFMNNIKVYQHDGKQLVELEQFKRLNSRAEGYRKIINEQHAKLIKQKNSIENN